MIYSNVTELIGRTPVVKLNRVVKPGAGEVLLKLESFNPGGSVKDRIGLNMILDAEQRGVLKPGGTIIEPTSGNTGLGLAMVAAVRGYRLILVMPDSMSIERRKLFKAYGADFVLTPGPQGMGGAVRKAQELAGQNDWFLPQQFENPSNPEAHRLTTGPEILEDVEGKLDYFVSTVGSGGTLTGTGAFLKERIPGLKVVAVEPAGSPVLSGGKPGMHGIQGIGAGFVPGVLDTGLFDRIITVKDGDAMNTARELAKREGILGGISTGAAAWAAMKIAGENPVGTRILAIAPDTGERYLSSDLFGGE